MIAETDPQALDLWIGFLVMTAWTLAYVTARLGPPRNRRRR